MNRFNGEVEEIEVLNSEFANQIFSSFDWEAALNRCEQAEVAGEECAVPGIAWQQSEACSPETVLRLIGQHYRAEHGALVDFLPRDEDPV